MLETPEISSDPPSDSGLNDIAAILAEQIAASHSAAARCFSVAADEEDFHVVPAPEDTDAEPDVVVDGPAAALDLWLWNRGGDDEVSAAGDRDVLERFTAIVESPIN